MLALLLIWPATASCLHGGAETYDDVSYIAIVRFTVIVPLGPQFSSTVNRIRWNPTIPDAEQGTSYNAWLKQRGETPLNKGFYGVDDKNAKALFQRMLSEVRRSDFYAMHLTPYEGHYVDGPADSVTVGRCGVLTTITFTPLGTPDTEQPDLDDANAKRLYGLMDRLQSLIYAITWHLEGPLNKEESPLTP
jgi:hypothetical protein